MLVWRVPSLNCHASLQERAAACWWQSLRHHGHNFGHWLRSSSDSCRKGRRSLAIWVSNESMHKRCAFWMDFDGFCDKAGVLVLVSTGTCKMLSVSTLGGCSEQKGSIVGCHVLLSLPKCEHLRKLSYWIASLTEWGIHWRPSNRLCQTGSLSLGSDVKRIDRGFADPKLAWIVREWMLPEWQGHEE